jgi:hypothetical protein
MSKKFVIITPPLCLTLSVEIQCITNVKVKTGGNDWNKYSQLGSLNKAF